MRRGSAAAAAARSLKKKDPPPPPVLKRATEYEEQCALFQFLRLWEARYPILGAVYSDQNGTLMHPVERMRAAAAGMRAGVWDVHIPVPMRCGPTGPRCCEDAARGSCAAPWGVHPCAYLEMKKAPNTVSREQEYFQDALSGNGVVWYVCYNWMEAARAVLSYLGLEDTEAFASIPEK